MKKILFALICFCTTMSYGQELSVLGCELGSSFEKTYKTLETRFGEERVYKVSSTEIALIDHVLGNTEWNLIRFVFQSEVANNTRRTYLSHIQLSNNFSESDLAFSCFKEWNEKLEKKYKYYSFEEQEKNGDTEFVVWYNNGEIYIHYVYAKAQNGNYYWHVFINYAKDFVDESNDY